MPIFPHFLPLPAPPHEACPVIGHFIRLPPDFPQLVDVRIDSKLYPGNLSFYTPFVAQLGLRFQSDAATYVMRESTETKAVCCITNPT